jgi:multidrug resistance efflux pump
VKLKTAVAHLDVARANLKIREIEAKGAAGDLDRVKQLAKGKLISQEELASKEIACESAQANVEKARAEVAVAEQYVQQADVELQMLKLVAPRDGTVFQMQKVLEGQSVSPDTPVITIRE